MYVCMYVCVYVNPVSRIHRLTSGPLRSCPSTRQTPNHLA